MGAVYPANQQTLVKQYLPALTSGFKLATAGGAFLLFATLAEKLAWVPSDLSKKAIELLFFSAPSIVLGKYALDEFEKIKANKLVVTPIYSQHSFASIKGAIPNQISLFLHKLENPHLYPYVMENNGFLLYGPARTGKTSLAYAIAHSAQMPLFVIRSSHIFKGGQARIAENITTIFETALETAHNNATGKAIILFDDIESFVPTSNDTIQNPALTALLAHLDDSIKDRLIIIATTNYPKKLDQALLLDGRLTPVAIPLPDQASREEIIEYFLTVLKVPVSVRSTIIKKFAQSTDGKSPATLKSIIMHAYDLAIYRKEPMSLALLLESADSYSPLIKTIVHRKQTI